MEATLKKCTNCNEEKDITKFHKRCDTPSGRTSHCKTCRNAHNRVYSKDPGVRVKTRKAHKKWYDKLGKDYQREIYKTDNVKARCAVSYAIRTGKLKKKPCRECGELKVEGHHWSYKKEHWLDVIWLCVPHHAEEHLRSNQ